MGNLYPKRAESLEIDSHGAPGMLLLQPTVTPENVDKFASFAHKLMRFHALVEVLACRVANFEVTPLIELWQSNPGRKADVEFLKAWLGNSDEMGGLGGRGLRVVKKASPQQRFANMDHARVARLAIESGKDLLGNNYNGPLFCSRLAQSLSCTVRASMASQPEAQTSGMSLEEFLATPEYGVMPIGNWRGHVFDFEAGGKVTWVGCDVPRPVFVPLTPHLA